MSKKSSLRKKRGTDSGSAPKVRREITHPEWLIVEDENGRKTWGADQSWFTSKRQRLSGCGPATAALISAYLARKLDSVSLFRPYRLSQRACGSIDSEHRYTKSEMLEHMNDIWTYVTPSCFGLYKAESFAQGLRHFCISRGKNYRMRIMNVSAFRRRLGKFPAELYDFIADGLVFDIPVAMLIRDHGQTPEVQSWHWVTITGIHCATPDGHCEVDLIDHLEKKTMNLDLWYQTTRLGGAFVACQLIPAALDPLLDE